jgi:hypothetical protein
MKLISVEYNCAGTMERTEEAKHDAERVVQALSKRFPQVTFDCIHESVGTWHVDAEGSCMPGLWARIAGFAEGFMASAFLWER